MFEISQQVQEWIVWLSFGLLFSSVIYIFLFYFIGFYIF